MALGIKKITESVVEDNRSLVMLGSYKSGSDIIQYTDNKAVPEGAVIASINSSVSNAGTLKIKSADNQQVKIDAHTTLAPKSTTKDEIKDNNILNRHLNPSNAADADRVVANYNIRNNAITKDKIKDNEVVSSKIPSGAILNRHLNPSDAADSARSVANYNIRNNAITTEKINNAAVTRDKIRDGDIVTNKIANNNVTRAKLSAELRSELDGLRSSISNLEAELAAYKVTVNGLINSLRNEINGKLQDLEKKLTAEMNNIVSKYNLANVVTHYNYDVVGDKSNGKYTSTPLSDLKCTGNITCSGDINGKRVYFMTYQDLAEGYVPGELLDAGDIVAMHEDGKVYRAESMNDCIVGVVSDEFANCLGATKEELLSGAKVAVGMIGKVHVKVKGPIELGQYINISLSDAGIGCGIGKACNAMGIGKALESVDCDFDEIHEVLVQIRPM